MKFLWKSISRRTSTLPAALAHSVCLGGLALLRHNYYFFESDLLFWLGHWVFASSSTCLVAWIVRANSSRFEIRRPGKTVETMGLWYRIVCHIANGVILLAFLFAAADGSPIRAIESIDAMVKFSLVVMVLTTAVNVTYLSVPSPRENHAIEIDRLREQCLGFYPGDSDKPIYVGQEISKNELQALEDSLNAHAPEDLDYCFLIEDRGWLRVSKRKRKTVELSVENKEEG